jgi:electron transport complex protein RnfG
MGSTVRLIVALTITCAVSALALSVIHGLTEEPIEEQKRQALMRAVQEVLPPFDNDPAQETTTIVLEEDEAGAADTVTVYLGTREGQISGVAFQTFGGGYGGFIDIMVGIDLDGRISGVKILEHEETPGLGAKIEEASFRDQFKGKSLDNSVLVNGILAVKNDGGDLDALTGATISPRGVAQAAGAGLKIFARHRQQIVGQANEAEGSAGEAASGETSPAADTAGLEETGASGTEGEDESSTGDNAGE